ncbi:hypothetical protein HOLleu_37946 [Holothuria leucospilota]|uniref:Sulfotransferase n=1 Tax=Holothuria leucospilota TaxID=206669 RepID=A0A9Q0YI00_HOLLE|nr:hypothetical protein HOLleu_37946 [Holothuria leucospilota]
MLTFLHMSNVSLPSVRFAKEDLSNHGDLLVQWHPAYNDSNVYYLPDVEVGKFFIFNPTAFTGADFFAQLIKDFVIQSGRRDIQVFNLTGLNAKSEPLEHQTENLRTILFGSWPSNVYIVSDAHVSDIFGPHYVPNQLIYPFSISFIRHPFDAFVASFHYHRQGQMLFSPGNETREQFLSKLSQTVGEVEKYLESGKEIRTYANDMSAVVPFCGGSDLKACSGVHPVKAVRIITRAKKNVRVSNTFIGLMEDFRDIPKLLERLSPGICNGLSQYTSSQAANFPAWIDTKIHLKRSVKEKLKRDNRVKLELRFYDWVKERYYNEKKRLLNENKL